MGKGELHDFTRSWSAKISDGRLVDRPTSTSVVGSVVGAYMWPHVLGERAHDYECAHNTKLDVPDKGAECSVGGVRPTMSDGC